MNTRIQELMTQAGTDSSGKWMGVDNAERFAQLILSECINICNSGSTTQTTSAGAAQQIAQHFGITER